MKFKRLNIKIYNNFIENLNKQINSNSNKVRDKSRNLNSKSQLFQTIDKKVMCNFHEEIDTNKYQMYERRKVNGKMDYTNTTEIRDYPMKIYIPIG